MDTVKPEEHSENYPEVKTSIVFPSPIKDFFTGFFLGILFSFFIIPFRKKYGIKGYKLKGVVVGATFTAVIVLVILSSYLCYRAFSIKHKEKVEAGEENYLDYPTYIELTIDDLLDYDLYYWQTIDQEPKVNNESSII